MPRLPRLHVPALENLASQLRFESPEAARRQLERAEALALELIESEGSPDQPGVYPEAWIAFRITGLMPDTPAEAPKRSVRSRAGAPHPRPADAEAAVPLIPRDALMHDLGAFIDRLSSHARLAPSDLACAPGPLGARWVSIDELCARWEVSRKTVARWKRQGLTSRRIRAGDARTAGRERVMFAERMLDAFSSRRPATVEQAARFSRTDAAARRRIIADARELLNTRTLSLDRCAALLAKAHARSPGTIRSILASHDRAAKIPLFPARRTRLSPSARAGILDHARTRANAAAGARAADRSRSTVYRLVNDALAGTLRALDLSGPVGPMFEHPEASNVLLGPEIVRTELGRPSPLTLDALTRAGATMKPTSAAVERTLAGAYSFLRWRASRQIDALPRSCQGASRALDAIVADLLWSARIKGELVRLLLPVLLRSLDERLPASGGGPTALPRDPQLQIARLGLNALALAVDQFDPFKGGRLAAPAIVALGRAFAHIAPTPEAATRPADAVATTAAPKATRRSASVDLLPVADWTRSVCSWQAELDLVLPMPSIGSLPGAIEALPALQREIVIRRFGYDLLPPRTVRAIAVELGRPEPAAAAALRRALRTLRQSAAAPGSRGQRS